MTNAQQTHRFVLEDRTIPGGYLVMPRSHLMDQYRAECAAVFLPERVAEPGEMIASFGPSRADPRRRRWRRPPPIEAAPEGRWIIDMRSKSPENFSHFLNQHLPICFHLSEVFGLEWEDALLLVPPEPAKHVTALTELFGLEIWPTPNRIEGNIVDFSIAPRTSLRQEWANWVGAARPQRVLQTVIAGLGELDLPKKFFLARRDTRCVTNAAEIEALLAQRGFQTIYAEDYPIPVQLKLFRDAEAVVAIHGAGLAPLLYCAGDTGPRHLIELLPVGITVDIFREMAARVGCAWIGVQGRIKPSYVKGLYRLDQPFTAFEFDNFEVDPAALEMAFDILETNAAPNS